MDIDSEIFRKMQEYIRNPYFNLWLTYKFKYRLLFLGMMSLYTSTVCMCVWRVKLLTVVSNLPQGTQWKSNKSVTAVHVQ